VTCVRCDQDPGETLFCGHCGKVNDPDALRRVRLMGPVGVLHSNSPKIEEFYATGDPEVFGRP
jgi:hypothetical protein